jgi:aminopeptidase
MPFSDDRGYPSSLVAGARAAVKSVLAVKKDERLLIVSNPNRDVRQISMAIYDAASEAGASPTIMFQGEKGQFDFTDEGIIKALSSEPEIVLSISKDRFGKDRHGLRHGYKGKRKYDDLFEMLYEEKKSRAFWSPGITRDMFRRTVPVDYERLRADCARLSNAMRKAATINVTAPGGTDISIGVSNRKPKLDDGDYRAPGKAGNLPSGEVYVSPALGASSGVIAFDGSIVLNEGEARIRTPIRAAVENGFIKRVSGGSEAKALRNAIIAGQRKAMRLAGRGDLSKKNAETYSKNSKAIGELGIGMNRSARIVANMLEDEKVYGTCHFAVGSNYDGDGECLIHLDGLVKCPTITCVSVRGSETAVMVDGKLAWDK